MESNNGAGRRKKMLKKALKGDIVTTENYFECKKFNVQGLPVATFVADPTRTNSKHELNLSELRDMVIALMTNKATPKYFQFKNRPFIRTVVILHVGNCTDFQATLSGLQLAPQISMRLSRNPVELSFLPQKLLTVSLSSCSEEALLTNNNNNAVTSTATTAVSTTAIATTGNETLAATITTTTGVAPSSSSTSSSSSVFGVLCKYAMSPSLLRLWDYPLVAKQIDTAAGDCTAAGSIVTGCDAGDADAAECHNTKRRRVDEAGTAATAVGTAHTITSPTAGLYCGTLPAQEEAVSVLSKLPTFGTATPCSSCAKGLAAGISRVFGCCYVKTVSAGNDGSASSPSFQNALYSASSAVTVTVPIAPLNVAAVDCEMVETAIGQEVARVTIVDENCVVLLDALVQPAHAVTDYRTPYSGITAKLLDGVGTTLQQVQVAVLRLVSAETVLVGHSLDNDLRAMHIIHTRCVDTALLYPHPKGYPLRLKLKVLAADYLSLRIQQTGPGLSLGHDSAEDARAAMRLALLKAEKGPHFGVKDSDDTRVPICGQFSAADSETLLAWESDRGACELGGGTALSAPILESDSTDSLCDEALPQNTVEVDATPDQQLASLEAQPQSQSQTAAKPRAHQRSAHHEYLMESCIGGNAAVAACASGPAVIDTACRFIGGAPADCPEARPDVVRLAFAGVRGGGATEREELLSHIARIKSAVERSGSHGLLLVTAQNSTDTLLSLRSRRRVCTQNAMSSVVWGREQEEQLRAETAKCAMGGLVLTVL